MRSISRRNLTAWSFSSATTSFQLSDAPAFTGSPLAASVDGVTYTIQGSTNLSDFTTTVLPVDPVVPGTLPPAGTGYSYRSFILDGSNGLPAKGFLRARVTN